MGKIFQQRNRAMQQMQNFPSVTIGTVMDTNDPQQMGRLKIMCPSLGDDNTSEQTDHLPWATYGTPFGGMVNNNGFTRGPNAGNTAAGPVAYGMWGIPKRGSSVIVMCIDGDPYYRVWTGSIFDQGSVNTLPHGRFSYTNEENQPEGPVDSYEQPIQPLYDNQTQAFGGRQHNFEWRTRGPDFGVGGNSNAFVQFSPSLASDDTVPVPYTADDGTSFVVQNGYATNRLPGFGSDDESSVYSWTSPGFHSISMDDRSENCRVRVRTTSGTQLILDDTNERIYINNGLGSNWLQMDFDGNIDVYAQMRINLHAESDINIMSDETVRIYGKQGVYIKSDGDIIEQAGLSHQISAGTDVVQQASQIYSVLAGTNIGLQAVGTTNISAGVEMLMTAPEIQLNGPQAAAAAVALPAKWPNRTPQHEPWARGTTANDYTLAPKYSYNSPNIGRDDKVRGQFWRR